MPKSSLTVIIQNKFFLSIFLLLGLQACSLQTKQSNHTISKKESYSVIISGNQAGYLKVTRSGHNLELNYDYKSNGRGPTIKEYIRLDSEGYPMQWDVTGNTTFGNDVNEHYKFEGQKATWLDATGSGEKSINQAALYIDQFGSPYSLFINANVLLNSKGNTATALPAGQLKLTEMERFQTSDSSKPLNLISYAITGAGLNPSYFILDDSNAFFAAISPRSVIIRDGYESEEEKMRKLAEKYSAQRFEKLQAQFAHNYDNNIRIRNVRVFDPETLSLTNLVSVLIEEDKISGIDSTDTISTSNEIEIDGQGGTLVPGLYDMHGHMGVNSALLNVTAGVTSVRDMGNKIDVLDSLIEKIESGVLAGPRITRLGMIEGKSPFNNNNGVLVENLEQALEQVQMYADKGFYGIKLYNSMNGDWAPEIIKKAHDLGLHVAGHVPAFSNANAMIKAGYDEMTHINQIMLGWVLSPEEDTRTLLRLTALQRLPNLDLNNEKVKETIDLMVNNKASLDPTLAIHEALLLGRNGETQQGVLDYIEHMPANVQRNAKVAWASIANDDEDKAYKGAYDKIIATLKMMKDKGIFLIPGTDLGGALNMHRELELYQQLGYTPAELVKLGSYDMAQYLGHKNRGAIKPGMLADFFLIPGDPTKDLKAIKTISMVSRGGVIYYPSEIYPEFGIKPFVDKPNVTGN